MSGKGGQIFKPDVLEGLVITSKILFNKKPGLLTR